MENKRDQESCYIDNVMTALNSGINPNDDHDPKVPSYEWDCKFCREVFHCPDETCPNANNNCETVLVELSALPEFLIYS